MLAQIRIIKVHEVLAQITRDNFFSMKGQGQKLGVCWHNHKKIDFNMFQHRSQETFFLSKDKDKKEVCVGTNQNKQIQKCVSTNHK